LGWFNFFANKYAERKPESKTLNKLILVTTINEPIIIFILETIFGKIQNEPNSINAFLALAANLF